MLHIGTLEKAAIKVAAIAGAVVGSATTVFTWLMYRQGVKDCNTDIERSGYTIVDENGHDVRKFDD